MIYKKYNGYFLEDELYYDATENSYMSINEEYDEEYENWVAEQIDKAIKEIVESTIDEEYEDVEL